MSNVGFVRELYDAFGRGDVGAVLAAMDPDIEWREAEGNPYQPDGSVWIGAEAILTNLFAKLASDWDGTFTVTPKEFSEEGNTVVIEGRYTGTWAATGKNIDAQFCHILRIRDGLITHVQEYTDTAQLRDVMVARKRASA